MILGPFPELRRTQQALSARSSPLIISARRSVGVWKTLRVSTVLAWPLDDRHDS